MTALIRGELIKTVTTRTLLGYALTGVALAIVNVVIVTQFSGELDTVSDKREAIAGLPIMRPPVRAGRRRGRVPPPDGRPGGARGGTRPRAGCCWPGRAPTPLTGLAIGALMVAVALVARPAAAGRRTPGRALGAHDVALVAGGSLIAAALSAIMGVAVGALVAQPGRGRRRRADPGIRREPADRHHRRDRRRVHAVRRGVRAGRGSRRRAPCRGAGPRWCWSPGRCRC